MPKQFSLRLMLVVVTVLCIALGVWSSNPVERRRRAVGAIFAVGGGINYVERDPEASESNLRRWLPREYFDDVQAVAFGNVPVTDDALADLKVLTALRIVTLYRTRITDAGLVHLQGLTELKELYLDGTKITDAGLVHLQGLTGLRSLYLYDTQVTEVGVARLQKALPKCQIQWSIARQTPPSN
jgi:hypothetical protein